MMDLSPYDISSSRRLAQEFQEASKLSPNVRGTSQTSSYIPFAIIPLVKASYEAKPGSRGGEIDHIFMGGIHSGSIARVWKQGGKEHATMFTITTFLL